MGQKKRSTASRHINGSMPMPASGLQETTGQLAPIDSESCFIGSELVPTEGTPDITRAGGGLEGSNISQEETFTVRSDCEKALIALRRGNTTKALKLIRDACARYETTALVQRVHGHICFRLASMIEDATTKQRHLKEAIEAAHKAVVLSPRSVEYSQFHAQLLFDAATDSKAYEEVVQECKRALEIEDPIDPAKESLNEEGQHKLPTAEARIAQVHQELQNLIQKANIASISNWMKTLGNGGSEEKLRFIHMRKLVDDPMEQRVSQPKRPHEVKKSVKTPEEKRKDIEVRVAAARLLQQKRDCSPPHSAEKDLKPTRSGARLERRKSGGTSFRKFNQTQSIEEKIEWLKPFWNSLGSHEREKMLEIPLDALKQQYSSAKMSLTSELLIEALEFAQEKKTWRFWMCCSCVERFIDCHEHAEHVMHKHIDSLSSKLRRLLPHEIDQEIADQILAEDCWPFNGPAAIKLLIDSCQAGSGEELAMSPVVGTAVCDCLAIASVSSRESYVDSLSESMDRNAGDATGDLVPLEPFHSLDNGDKHGDMNVNACMCDEKCQRSKRTLQIGRDLKRCDFPLAEDEERKKLLQKIFNLFSILIKNKCLASDHMEKIVQYAVDELQTFIPDSSVQYEFNHSPIYIRFLPAPQLRRIFGYLRELVNACGFDQLLDSAPPPQNEEEDVILDRLFLNGDFTALTLDERLLKESSGKVMEFPPSIDSDNCATQDPLSIKKDPGSISYMIMKDGETIPHTDLQLLWIYQKADYEHQPAGWKQLREARTLQGRDILQALEKEFLSLQTFCERKREHLHYEEAVIMAEALCIEELKKRELKADGNFVSHEAVLRKHQQELLENRALGLSSQQKLELDVIRSILREAQTINLPQFPYESSIAVTSGRLSDSDEEDEDSWKVPDFVPQLDPCIEVAIQRQKERATSEVNKLDARILRSMDSVQRLELKLGNASVLDYRSILLPLVKSFLKSQLEDAAEKDALRKSDAARDAFLAELSRDEKTSTERPCDSVRHVKDRAKDKKKTKENRRFKDGKRVSGAAVLDVQKTAGNGSTMDVVGEDHEEYEKSLEGMVAEDELRRQAEVEDEERKLAETLELQRRVEEEAKEKHFAELKKKQEAQGASQVPAGIVCIKSDVLFCSGDPPQSPFHEEDTVAQLLKKSLVLESPVVQNVVVYTSKSTSNNQVFESLVHSSVQACTDQDTELPLNESGALDHTYRQIQLTGDWGSPTNSNVRALDPHLPSSSRPKRSRRRKTSRTSQDDNNQNIIEEKITGCRSSMYNEREFGNGAGEGVKPFEAGLACKERQISDENGGLKSSRGTTQSLNKTLRELKAEQDAEERFQADLEQAMQQSLANVAESAPEIFQTETMENNHLIMEENKMSMAEEVGKGLQNEIGQYNCFLNVVIQSLWHLRRFREEVLAISSINHLHMGDPCVVCALRDIFVGLNSPRLDISKQAVAPTSLRIALSNLYSEKDFFQEAQMNDASEVLAVVFDCLHKAFTTGFVLSDGDSDTSSGIGFWECQDHSSPCITHSLFALDITEQMNCANCGLESRHLKYTSFFHNINASSLRTAKILYQDSSLDELLRLVDMNQFLGCDIEVGGCGQQNYMHYLLRAAPHVFITVLGWQNNRESFEDIAATMDAIAVEMDVGVVYRGLDKGFKHRLISVICYYGQHYHCFAFNHEFGRWVMFDDTTVKMIGAYKDVVDTCRRGHLQPQVLFYEGF